MYLQMEQEKSCPPQPRTTERKSWKAGQERADWELMELAQEYAVEEQGKRSQHRSGTTLSGRVCGFQHKPLLAPQVE